MFQNQSILLMQKSKSQHKLNLILSSASTHLQNSQAQAICPRDTNLFKNQSLERLRNMQFQESRAYQYVGVKELKAFYERSRQLNRESKRTTVSGLYLTHKISTMSTLSRTQPSNDLLTKKEVMESRIKEREHLRTDVDVRGGKVERFTTDQSFITDKPKLSLSFENEGKSLQKIKEKYKKYESMWTEMQEKSQQSKGFPSLLTEIPNQKQITKQTSSLEFQKSHINNRMWEKVLREPHGLVSIYDKKGSNFMKLNKKGLGLLGKNKLSKETDWIGYKENEGYKFKSLKKQF